MDLALIPRQKKSIVLRALASVSTFHQTNNNPFQTGRGRGGGDDERRSGNLARISRAVVR